jgi:hypothetical protein
MPRFLELELEEQLRSLSSCRWCDFSSSCSLLSSSKRPQLLSPCPSLNPNVPIDSIAAVQPSSIFSVGGRPPELSTAASKTRGRSASVSISYTEHAETREYFCFPLLETLKFWNYSGQSVSAIAVAACHLRWTESALNSDFLVPRCDPWSLFCIQLRTCNRSSKEWSPFVQPYEVQMKRRMHAYPHDYYCNVPLLYTKLGEIRNVGGWAW